MTMAEKHLSNDDFFLRLSELFEQRRKEGHGSVFLTQKCLSFGNSETLPEPTTAQPFPDLEQSQPLPILVRATDGKSGFKNEKRKERTKISTLVQPDSVESFFVRYSEVCKSGMSALKKRDRSKRKLKAKKKKGGVAVEEVKKA